MTKAALCIVAVALIVFGGSAPVLAVSFGKLPNLSTDIPTENHVLPQTEDRICRFSVPA